MRNTADKQTLIVATEMLQVAGYVVNSDIDTLKLELVQYSNHALLTWLNKGRFRVLEGDAC